MSLKFLNIYLRTFRVDQGLLPSSVNHREVPDRVSLLCYAMELSQLKNTLPLMLDCFKHFHISLPDLNVLEGICSQLSRAPITLSVVAEWMTKIRRLISDLSATSMQYFRYVKLASHIVKYFSEQTEFQKKFDLIVTKYQGHVYGLEKLNNMFSVFEMLEPFIVLLKGNTYFYQAQFSILT